jgi:hypothetical protein
MRRDALFCGLAAIALLASCGREPSVEATNESPEAVAGKVAASGLLPQPGRWQANLRLESFDIPGMPASAKQEMGKALGGSQSYFSCLTAEQAVKPDADFFQKAAPGCTYEKFIMADGKIDAVMACPGGAGPTRMAMTGTYGADLYDIKITGSGEMAKGMPMNIVMGVTSRRVGECNGTEG